MLEVEVQVEKMDLKEQEDQVVEDQRVTLEQQEQLTLEADAEVEEDPVEVKVEDRVDQV
jgi:hypothetical protein